METTTVRNEPKYRQLFVEFRDRIMSGELRSGDRLPTVAALWTERRVTPTTVDKAYSLLEQESLIERRHGSGTYVAEKKPACTSRIGFIDSGSMERFVHPYWSRLLGGVQSAAISAQKQVLFLNATQIDERIRNNVDGLIYCAIKPDERVTGVDDAFPCVCVLARSSYAPSIVSDDYAGSMALTRHLVGLGHRRIAMLSVDYTWTAKRRLEGYKDVLSQAGIGFDDRLVRPVHGPFKPRPFEFEQDARERMTEWLASDWSELGCTAIMAQNDDAAVGVVQACHAAGKRVPEDISVAGFDGTEIGRLVSPALTSVEIPLTDMGEAAVQTLAEILTHGAARYAVVSLPTRLIERSSTGPAPAN